MKKKTYTLNQVSKDMSAFIELKKKFNEWGKSKREKEFPFAEVVVEPYKNKYKLSYVISRMGNIILDTKFIYTFKNFNILDKWRKSDYKISYVIAKLPFLK